MYELHIYLNNNKIIDNAYKTKTKAIIRAQDMMEGGLCVNTKQWWPSNNIQKIEVVYEGEVVYKIDKKMIV